MISSTSTVYCCGRNTLRSARVSQLSVTLPVAFLLIGSAGTSGCSASDIDTSFSVSDSSGVSLVHNSDERAAHIVASLGTTPRLTVGATGSHPEAEFGRVVSALRRTDGGLIVGDGLSREIRLFGGDGQPLASVGGRGDGPDEFRSLQGVGRLPGDSVMGYQAAPAKMVAFSTVGGSPRVVTLESPPTPYVYPQHVGTTNDGSIVAIAASPASQAASATRPQVAVVRYRPSGAIVNVIAEASGPERISMKQGPAVVTRMIPFGRNTLIAVGGDVIILMDTHEPVLRYLDGEGRLTKKVSFEHSAKLLTDEYWRAYVDSILMTVQEDQRAGRRASMEELPRPDRLPIARMMLLDSRGFLWLALAGSDRWLLFDVDGRMIGHAALPAALTPTDIGEDYLVGIWRDELDVESVRLYDLSLSRSDR